jgi:hypothetical protein
VHIDPGARGLAFAVEEARRQVVMKAQDREGCNDGLVALASQFLLALFSKPEGEDDRPNNPRNGGDRQEVAAECQVKG